MVLVIEDNADTRELLRYVLEAEGMGFIPASDGLAGLKLAARLSPRAVVLDLMLPGLDGLDVCRKLKSSPPTADIPIIMLTAKTAENDRIVGFEAGADDYLTKPFSPRELVLRLKALLRRMPSMDGGRPWVWEMSGLRVDFAAHVVEINGTPVHLTATEFRLLCELLHSKGETVSRDRLLSMVWDSDEGYSRTVDTHIRRLRMKLGKYAQWIRTIRGTGYALKNDGA